MRGSVVAGALPRTAGHVVPGSGTGELASLSGTMEIHVDADGKHTLALDYQVDQAAPGGILSVPRRLDLPSSRSPQMRQASYEIARTLRPCSTLPSGT